MYEKLAPGQPASNQLVESNLKEVFALEALEPVEQRLLVVRSPEVPPEAVRRVERLRARHALPLRLLLRLRRVHRLLVLLDGVGRRQQQQAAVALLPNLAGLGCMPKANVLVIKFA
jgi:hypothetical protein